MDSNYIDDQLTMYASVCVEGGGGGLGVSFYPVRPSPTNPDELFLSLVFQIQGKWRR